MLGQFDELQDPAERPPRPMRVLSGFGATLRRLFIAKLDTEASVADAAEESSGQTGDTIAWPFFGIVTASAADGASHWTYSVTEREKTVAGYGGWTNLANGRSVTARNWYEENPQVLENTPAELQNQEIKAVGNDTIVLCWPVALRTATGVTLEYWFYEVNDFDAECA
ncbi:MAG TPA: hypothetical protein VMW52_10075 [Phycisphaerae bacterium]|nr:hypothetical protein [Phycisphaerae bacterium]